MRRTLFVGLTAIVSGITGLASCSLYSETIQPLEVEVFASTQGSFFRSVMCVRLPVLLGSQVDQRASFDDLLDIVAEATRSGLDLRFFVDGVEGATQSFARTDLTNASSVEVTTGELGSRFRVRLSANCTSVGTGGASGVGGFAGFGGTGEGGAVNNGGDGGRFGSGGTLGTGGVVNVPVPLRVSQLSPTSGAYGTTVVIDGQGFGTQASTDVSIALARAGSGNAGAAGDAGAAPEDAGDAGPSGGPASAIVLASSSPEIVSWREASVRFRYPFPGEGSITLTGKQGSEDESVVAGSFLPAWVPGQGEELAGTATAITAISDVPGHLLAVLGTTPPTLVGTDGKTWSIGHLDVPSVRPDTIRLFRADGIVRGYALSTAEPPTLVSLVPTATGVTVVDTAVSVSSTFALAAGDAGAAVWFLRADGWRRARPGATTWTVDKGPVAAPNPSAALHTVVATSDGGLHVVWAEKTGSTFDDTGTPFVQTLASESPTFGTPTAAGDPVDDYLTTLVAESRGDGFLLRYCGSDVDPFGFSGGEYRCRLAVRAQNGLFLQGSWKDDETSHHIVRQNQIGALRCNDVSGTSFVANALATSAEEVALWPCAPIVAAAMDENGITQFIVRSGSALYSPKKR